MAKKAKQDIKNPSILREADDRGFKKWRTSGENILSAIFKYAADKDAPARAVKIDGQILFKRGLRFNERTNLYEDHFKMPAIDLPKAVYTAFGQEAMDGRESWKALKAFDKAVDKKMEAVEEMIANQDESAHSLKNLRYIRAQLEAVRHSVHIEAERYGLARIGPDNYLEFDSYKQTRTRIILAYNEKSERRNARVSGQAASAKI